MTRQLPPRQRDRRGSTLRDIVSGRAARKRASLSNDTGPRSSYEAVTRQMVKSLTYEVRDVKNRVNQLITLLVGAILLEVLMRLIGSGG